MCLKFDFLMPTLRAPKRNIENIFSPMYIEALCHSQQDLGKTKHPRTTK